MVLLNILYGFILALAMSLGLMVLLWTPDFHEAVFATIWATWSVGHIVYDAVAYQVVKLFNKKDDGVYRG